MSFFIPAPNIGLPRVMGKPAMLHVMPHWLSLFLCLLLAVKVFSQGTGAYTISRVEERRVEYLFPDSLTGFPLYERTLLLPRITRDSVIINVYANSDIKTTSYHLEDNQFEPWMTRPAKSINDKKMLRVYDAGNVLLLSQVHSPEYKSHLTTLKSHLSSTGADLIPDYSQLTTSLKSGLLSEGFIMANLGAGTYRFSKDSVELYYNNSRKYNELIMKYTDGSVKYSVRRDFRVNASGQTVPYIIRETYPDERFPGACVMVLNTVTYPYYMRTSGILRTAGDDDLAANELEVFPNPASGQCTVQLPAQTTAGTLQVLDMAGHVVYMQETLPDQTACILDCSGWQNGMYRVEWQDGLFRISTLLVKTQ